jgi:predicted RNase H-like HicB family nuclease
MAHGNTQEDAMREIKIALGLWIETANENGIKIPEPMLYVS